MYHNLGGITMKKHLRKILSVALAIAMIVCALPAMLVGAEELDLAQTWTDDFGSGKGDYYTPHGWWWNLDGQLTVGDTRAGAGVCYYWLKDMVWTDFVMEFDVINQTSEFGVILRAQQQTANDCQNQGYGVLCDTNWAFFMAENGTFTGFDALQAAGHVNPVDNLPWATQPGASNVHWKIVAKGNRIEVYFNGAATPSMAMDATLYRSGAIGFRTFNPGGAVTAVVDNLSITELHTLTEVPAQPGKLKHYTCSTCDRIFADAEATQRITDINTCTNGHNITKVAAKPAGETTTGNKEYYTCQDCGVCFSDAEGTTVIDKNTMTIPATGRKQPHQEWKDDFKSGKGGSYTPYGIYWNENGALTIGGAESMAGWTYYYLNDMVWGDFTMEFDVEGQANSFGAVIRANKPGAGPDDGDGYAIMSDRAWCFVGKLKGTWEQIKTPENSHACPHPGDTAHWKIVARGETISVYFNHSDTPSIVVNDSTWSAGQIGFRCLVNQGQAGAVTVKNLVVIQEGNPKTGDISGVFAALLVVSGIGTVALISKKGRMVG